MADVEAVMKKYDRESNTRVWEGWQKKAIHYLMAAFAIYCIIDAIFLTTLQEVRYSVFMGMIILLGFLTFPVKKGVERVNHIPWYDVIIAIIGSGAYFFYAANAMTVIKLSARIMANPLFMVVGAIGILALVELCRRCVGLPILCVAGVLVIYTLFSGIGLPQLIRTLFYTANGIFSTPVGVCVKYIVIFIIFGAFLEKTGVADFFIRFANTAVGRFTGGPAKVAVVASALEGMASGSSVANTVGSGSITIPMMKKMGYRPEFAAAVEAAASTGGQIMPPIMGAAAFLMAEFTGIPYGRIAVMAILPAVLYFTGIFIAVHLEAKKSGMKGIPKEQLPKVKDLVKDLYLLLPLIALIYLVGSNTFTMAYSATLSIVVAMVVGIIHKIIPHFAATIDGGEEEEKGEKPTLSFRWILDSFENGSRSSITVVVACGIAGIISGCITVTGLASILLGAIVALSHGIVIVALVLTMLCCIVLGMGVPTTANYCIMAGVCAPILIALNVEPVAAHFFVFYFGIVADITPPVALAAYAGSAIAKSDPMRTGLVATKLAIAAFIVPYVFAMNPAMLFVNVTSVFEVIQICITALLGIFGIAAALNGYLGRALNPIVRIILAIAGLCMVVPGTITDLIGLVALVLIVVYEYGMKRKEQLTQA
ncbi:MAG: TRAP transporter fused permease subunit [Spirochaetes bacterium]|uniref:TRAP transporter fused permease subunit n=1 Tax=Candidatus Ornithospirochaeta stercoripullorum TaxID=2840899 RepID=A0A9D9H5S3_9SPIO|nr:TRAP transporter fused permease subunit [Candidatus Ornithospirochaeta stercoripullorum]